MEDQAPATIGRHQGASSLNQRHPDIAAIVVHEGHIPGAVKIANVGCVTLRDKGVTFAQVDHPVAAQADRVTV